MVYKPNRPYVNIKETLTLAARIKKRLKAKQKGGSLAAILDLIVKVASALFGSGKKRYTRKDRIVIVKRDMPKLARLPYGRTFYTQYKRTIHVNLPAKVELERV